MYLRKSQTCFLIAAALFLGACSAEVSGGPGLPNPPLGPQKPNFPDPSQTVAGPSVEGHWVSSCKYVTYEKAYRIFDVTFTGEQVVRVEKKYSDAACASVPKVEERKGIFRFNRKYDESTFNIEYAFGTTNGGATYPQERIAVKNGNVYLSGFTQIAVLDEEPLYRDGKKPTPPPVTSCTNYTGRWNMNGAYFSIAQQGCQQIEWISERIDGSVAGRSLYMLDGVPRVIEGKSVTSSVKNSNWTLEYAQTDGSQVVIEYSLQRRPCNLANPDGSEYLTKKTYLDGRYYSCSYWARHN